MNWIIINQDICFLANYKKYKITNNIHQNKYYSNFKSFNNFIFIDVSDVEDSKKTSYCDNSYWSNNIDVWNVVGYQWAKYYCN